LLYDVWSDLYGKDFTERMVSIERRIGRSYEEAWAWALTMTREERRARLAGIHVAASASKPPR
jgi:hypothetical protein